MIEGQEDVTWEDWVALADACERSGIEALFRSDHYVSVFGEDERGSLDAWGTINALAARTTTLRLGTMVSPSSFRHPSVLAKLAATADHVSGGRDRARPRHRLVGDRAHRVRLPVPVDEGAHGRARGAARDHPRRPLARRARSASRARYYELDGPATPARSRSSSPHPPLIMGGGAGPRAARLAARYADEYNTVMPTLERDRASARPNIDAACEKAGPRADPVHGHVRLRDRRRPGRVRAPRRRSYEAWTGVRPRPETGSPAPSSRSRRGCAELRGGGRLAASTCSTCVHRDTEMVELIGRELD